MHTWKVGAGASKFCLDPAIESGSDFLLQGLLQGCEMASEPKLARRAAGRATPGGKHRRASASFGKPLGPWPLRKPADQAEVRQVLDEHISLSHYEPWQPRPVFFAQLQRTKSPVCASA